MTLTLTHYGVKHSIEMERDDLTLPELIEELIIPALLSIGFDRETIEKNFGDGPVARG